MLAALDDPTCQGLTRDIDAVASEHFFETMEWQAVQYLVVNNIASTLGLAMLFSIIWAGLSAVTGADPQSRHP